VWVDVAADGRQALSVGNAQEAILWDPATARTLRRWPGPSLCGAFSPDGRIVALGLADGRVEIYATATGDLLRSFQTDSARIQSIAFAADGSRLGCGGTRGTVHLFNPADWQEVVDLRVNPATANRGDTTVSSLAFAAAGNVLAAYLNDGRIRLWRTDD
jgi:WD40 repeat protein